MEKRSSLPTFRLHSKDEITKKAREGVFNCNPLLASSHELVCEACGSVQKITYLDHLKSGSFEMGKTRAVEVTVAAPTISGLSRTTERITPIIIRVKCKRCKNKIFCSPISLEYLLFTARKQQKSEYMYV